MKTNLIIGLVVLGSLLNTACSIETMDSQDVAPKGTHQSYSATYNADGDNTEFYAQFRAGGSTGTTLSLSTPAEVKANSSRLSSAWSFGTYYSSVVRGFQPNAKFTWVDNSGATYENSIVIKPLVRKSASATISVNQPYVVELSAENLSSNEYVSVTISQEIQGEKSKEWTYIDGRFDPRTQKAVFPVTELAKLRNGPAKLTSSRNGSSGLQQSPSKGVISAHYVLQAMNITVMDAASAQVSLAKE